MAKIGIDDLQSFDEIGASELSSIRGGIDTVPLPERPWFVCIGTWPTPERASSPKRGLIPENGRLSATPIEIP